VWGSVKAARNAAAVLVAPETTDVAIPEVTEA